MHKSGLRFLLALASYCCIFNFFPLLGMAQCGCDHVIDPAVVYINGNDAAFNFSPGDVVCLQAGKKSELWIINVRKGGH